MEQEQLLKTASNLQEQKALIRPVIKLLNSRKTSETGEIINVLLTHIFSSKLSFP